MLYEVDPTAGWVVGIDVGRSFVRAAIADLSGTIVARRDEHADVRSAATLITQIGEFAHGLAAEAGLRWRQVTFAVVGSPGVFEPSRGLVALAHNLPGWGRPGLAEALERELGTNLAFENDVNLAAVGERWKGLGQDVDDFAYLHVGTGVGMGLVLRGKLYRGHTGAAGEIAYLPLELLGDPHDRGARRRGVLESAIGAAGVVAHARQLGMKPPLTPKKVFAAARRGDGRAAQVVSTVAQGIALAIAAVAPIVDPELVILGGGIGRNGDLLLAPVGRELRAVSPFLPRIEVSTLGDDATVDGAVAMALAAARDRLYSRGRRATVVQLAASRGVVRG